MFQYLYSVFAAVFYGLFMRLLFGFFEGFEVMSASFLGLVPFAFGFLSVWLSKIEKAKSRWFAFFFPWKTTLILLVATVLLSIEGTICWLMIYPFFSTIAGFGGLLARYFLIKKLNEQHKSDSRVLDDIWKNNGLQVSVLMLLPVFAGFLEGDTHPKATFGMSNSIDIAAPADQIWQNVVRVPTIQPHEDGSVLATWLGLPRPLEAVLDTLAVGGYRKAIFERGLIFHETVTQYTEQENMVFRIDVNPDEVPPTALDEHIVVGGKYFDVLLGAYRLEKLPATDSFRLHLQSSFEVSTPFNFYSGQWARWIMWDIQQNILQVIRQRSEQNQVKE